MSARTTRLLPLVALLSCGPKIDRGPIPAEAAAAPVRMVERPDPSAPNVYIQAMVHAGSAYDQPGQEGLAWLTATSMVEAGAGDRTGSALKDALYPTGGAIEQIVDREWVTFRIKCPKSYASLCETALADVLTLPRFDEPDVGRARTQAIYDVTDGMLANEEHLAHEVLDAWLFEGHPYGHPVEGRAGVLPTLDGADARQFWTDHYVRESVWIGLAGAYDESMKSDLEARLAALPTRHAPELVLQEPPPFTGRHLLAVDTGTAVTGYVLGYRFDADRNDPDWPALYLAFTTFGEHRQSQGRLFRTLRTARGLNYGDYAYDERFVQRGSSTMPEQGVLRQQPTCYLWLRPTSAVNGPFAVKLAIDELERFAKDGLSDAEVAEMKTYLGGRIPLLATDPGRRLAYALDAAATGTPDLIADLPAKIAGLDTATVNAAIARHVHPENLKIVAVSGEADALVTALVESKPTPIVYADGIDPDAAQTARDAQIAVKDLGIAPEDARSVAAQGIFK